MRTKGPYHKLCLEEYIDFRNYKSDGDVKDALQKFTGLVESYVRKYPDQWLWLHKRWKSTPTRTILVLSDGKAGHLNQSLAIAQAIQKARTSQGYKPEDTKIVIVDVKFKSALARNTLSFCANLASWRCHGCMRCMRLCLKGETYETLMRTYSEFVVSCGSSLAAINIFMSKENNAKNIVIMKPPLLMGLRPFSLAVIPRHDKAPKASNVVTTEIAPNLVNEEALKSDAQKLKDRIGSVKTGAVGLFVGGDNPEFSLTPGLASSVLDSILDFCERHDAQLLVTTSRRTSAEVAVLLKKRLKVNPRCRLLVVANENNMEGAVGGMLALSRVAVVSGESISMISEAISSRKNTVVFELEKKNNAVTKHELALKSLETEGYLAVAKIDNLYKAMEDAWKARGPLKELKDREKIFESVRRLI